MDKRKKELGREKRGQVSGEELLQYESAPITELLSLLNSDEPKKRTIAATLIGNRKIFDLTQSLCKCLTHENSLYPRIAISAALGEIGESAVVPLIALLGKIGANQEIQLPEKYFEKKSFPLARDMAARTLVKIGKPAIPGLIDQIKKGASFETEQAIDAIGGIVAKTNDQRPLSALLQTFVDYPDNKILVWKIVRAFSAFKNIEVIEPLIRMLNNHPEPAIRWEAARSLGLVRISTPGIIQTLQSGMKDEHNEVRKAAGIALKQLLGKSHKRTGNQSPSTI